MPVREDPASGRRISEFKRLCEPERSGIDVALRTRDAAEPILDASDVAAVCPGTRLGRLPA